MAGGFIVSMVTGHGDYTAAYKCLPTCLTQRAARHFHEHPAQATMPRGRVVPDVMGPPRRLSGNTAKPKLAARRSEIVMGPTPSTSPKSGSDMDLMIACGYEPRDGTTKFII